MDGLSLLAAPSRMERGPAFGGPAHLHQSWNFLGPLAGRVVESLGLRLLLWLLRRC